MKRYLKKKLLRKRTIKEWIPIGIVSYFVIVGLEIPAYAIESVIGIAFLGFVSFKIHKYLQKYRIRISGISEVDTMTGAQFENFLGDLFRSLGYRVEVTKLSGDFGADIVIKKSGKTIVVQAKCYSKNVGLKAVQEVHSAKAFYKATEAWVVTNRDYTKAAYTLAEANKVRTINRQELADLMVQRKQRFSWAKRILPDATD